MATVSRVSRQARSRPSALNVRIENFGPISKGEIRLKPLTILMGPSNSGKSYAATLIYSLLSAYALSRHRSSRQAPFTGTPVNQSYDGLHPYAKKLAAADSFTVPNTAAARSRLVDAVFAPVLKTVLEASFGSPVKDLIRIRHKMSRVTISGSDSYEIKINDDLRIRPRFNNATSHKVRISQEAPDGVSEETDGNTRVLQVGENLKTAPPAFLARIVGDFLLGSLSLQPEAAHYLPAGRSGILQGYRAIAAGAVRHAPYAGAGQIEMPRMTQMASDVVSYLIGLPHKPGRFAALSGDLERDLLGGRIVLLQSARHLIPDIVYQLPGGNVPLSRFSSTVSEMAPLSLYLRHIIQENDLLIIEEPEAHLHVSSQIVLAKYIARMIRQGLNLLITTDSSVLVEALNSHLVASYMDPKARVKVGIAKNDYLMPDEVAPYLFRKAGKGGYVITPVETDEYGVEMQEFMDVTEPLYERGFKQDQWRERQELDKRAGKRPGQAA